MAFREDESRARVERSVQYLAGLRELALMLIQQDWTRKSGVKPSRIRLLASALRRLLECDRPDIAHQKVAKITLTTHTTMLSSLAKPAHDNDKGELSGTSQRVAPRSSSDQLTSAGI